MKRFDQEALLDRLAQKGRLEVLSMQSAQDIGAVAWRRLDSSPSIEAVREKALAVLREHATMRQ